MERARTKNSSTETSSFVLSQSFKVGFLNIRYYSLTFVGGIIAAYLVARKQAKKVGIDEKVFDDLVFWMVLIGFISARIYYVLFYFSEYSGNLSEIYKVWHGGLAIFGGLIGGAIALYFACRHYKQSFLKITDIIVLGIPLGQAIGRLGNYFNHEAFGKPTNLLWKIFIPAQDRPAGYQQYSYFHPAFAYEMIWNLLVFGILYLLSSKLSNKYKLLKIPGFLTAIYFILYSIGRFAIEAIRLDSAYFGPFKGDQLTSVIVILLSLGLMAYLRAFRYNR